MKLHNIMSGMALLALTSGTANASSVTIDFTGMPNALYAGHANTVTGCDNVADPCYEESGVYVSTTADEGAPSAHIHRGGSFFSPDKNVQHHGDAAGIYIRKTDASAFSFDSFSLEEAVGVLPGFVSHNIFKIEAFSEAFNTDIVAAPQGTGVNFLGTQTITDADVGTVTLDSIFSNVKGVWIHFDGYTNTPSDGANWDIQIDDLVISAVPVPAAAYLFATGLMGLLSFGKRRVAQTTA